MTFDRELYRQELKEAMLRASLSFSEERENQMLDYVEHLLQVN